MIPRPWLSALVALLTAVTLGCGTLLYPERQGQKNGHVDPGVLVMDGVLLLFFVIPGVVALAIDFYTGAIYRPGTQMSWQIPPEELTPERIEALTLAHLGEAIPLDDPRWQRFSR